METCILSRRSIVNNLPHLLHDISQDSNEKSFRHCPSSLTWLTVLQIVIRDKKENAVNVNDPDALKLAANNLRLPSTFPSMLPESMSASSSRSNLQAQLPQTQSWGNFPALPEPPRSAQPAITPGSSLLRVLLSIAATQCNSLSSIQ